MTLVANCESSLLLVRALCAICLCICSIQVRNTYQDFDTSFMQCLLTFATQTCLMGYYFVALEETIDTLPPVHLICSAVLEHGVDLVDTADV